MEIFDFVLVSVILPGWAGLCSKELCVCEATAAVFPTAPLFLHRKIASCSREKPRKKKKAGFFVQNPLILGLSSLHLPQIKSIRL